jgi:hypothetical protein
MAENGSESLPFEPPEQENIRLREENARLRRLLAVHSIPIPQLAPESPTPTKTAETAAPVDKEERARKRITLFRSLFRGGDGRNKAAGPQQCSSDGDENPTSEKQQSWSCGYRGLEWA